MSNELFNPRHSQIIIHERRAEDAQQRSGKSRADEARTLAHDRHARIQPEQRRTARQAGQIGGPRNVEEDRRCTESDLCADEQRERQQVQEIGDGNEKEQRKSRGVGGEQLAATRRAIDPHARLQPDEEVRQR